MSLFFRIENRSLEYGAKGGRFFRRPRGARRGATKPHCQQRGFLAVVPGVLNCRSFFAETDSRIGDSIDLFLAGEPQFQDMKGDFNLHLFRRPGTALFSSQPQA